MQSGLLMSDSFTMADIERVADEMRKCQIPIQEWVKVNPDALELYRQVSKDFERSEQLRDALDTLPRDAYIFGGNRI